MAAGRSSLPAPFPLILLLGVTLFVPLLAFRQLAGLDFWWGMAASLVALVLLAALTDRAWRAELRGDIAARLPWKLAAGLGLAAALYGVFYAGAHLFRALGWAAARQDIADVYAWRAGAAPLRIGLLMALVIGPGEELFWRGYCQRHLAQRCGPRAGFALAALLYAGVHLGTRNAMLVVAALVCGLAWGWSYTRFRSVALNAVSHAAWDIAVFLLFPLEG